MMYVKKHDIKKIIGLLLFLAGFQIIWSALYYILYDDTRSYNRYTFHDFYNQNNIDTLIVGSSHSFVSINPNVLDQELNINSFNIGRDTQTLDGSLLVIQEAAKRYHIEHVYLDIFYGLGYSQRNQKWTNGEEIYATADYLKPSILKLLYLLRASKPEQYLYSFFPMRRVWESLFDLDHIQNTVKNKSSDDYYNPANTSSCVKYLAKGFSPCSKEIKNWNIFIKESGKYHDSINSVIYTDGDWRNDLHQIIQYCKSRHIELTLFSSPMSDFLLTSVKNYDDYINTVRSILEGTGISYWDFNLCKEEYFPCDSTLFYNRDHLNTKGAEIFSHLFARYIKGDISSEELFYKSYDEKLRHLEPNVFGITYRLKNGEAGTTFRSCHIVSTITDNMEYQITIQPAEGESYLVQDYWWNTDFRLTEDGAGQIIIRYRVKGSPVYVGERIIDFPKK